MSFELSFLYNYLTTAVMSLKSAWFETRMQTEKTE